VNDRDWICRYFNVMFPRQIVLWLSVVLCASACSRGDSIATAPTPASIPPSPAPLPQASEFRIVASTEGVIVGRTVALAVVAIDPDGRRRGVAAEWSTNNSTVAAPGGESGVINGVSVGSATITATFERTSLTYTLNVVPDFAGTWRGQYVVQRCTWISGPGSSYCRFILGAAIPFSLALTQQGQLISGTINFYDTANRLLTSGVVEGRSTASGYLEIGGTVRSVEAGDEITLVADWKSLLWQGVGSMTGDFVKNREFTNAFGRQKSREDCVIRSATRT